MMHVHMPPAHVFRNILNHLKITYTSWQVLYTVSDCTAQGMARKSIREQYSYNFFFKKIYCILNYVSMRGFVHVNAGVLGGQKLVLDPRSWSSRQFYPTWVLGTKLLSSRGGYALSHWATSLALPKHFRSVKGRLLCAQTEKQLVDKMFHPDTVPDSAHLALYRLYLIWSCWQQPLIVTVMRPRGQPICPGSSSRKWWD